VALYITDNFDREHDAVWVTLNRIAAVNASGERALVEYSPGLVVNLPTLRRTGQWLGDIIAPTDIRTLRVYLEPTAKLQALDGSLKAVTIVTEGGYVSLPAEDWNWRSGTLAVDFDLSQFVLQGDVLTVATRLATDTDQQAWTLRKAEIEGQLTAIDDRRMTLRSARHGDVTINTDANTTFRSQQAVWTPGIGGDVEVEVSKSAGGTLVASAVSDRSQFDSSEIIEVEGQVTAIRGNQLTIDVIHSDSMSLVGSFSFDVANARFKRGSLGSLQTTQIVEAYVQQAVNGSWEANVIEIEGARKNSQSSNNPASGSDANNMSGSSGLVELAGPVTRVDTLRNTISLLGVEVMIDTNTRLRDDITDRRLALSDFRTGDFIDVYARLGQSNASSLVATVVERYPPGVAEAEGPGADWSTTTFTVAGVPIATTANTRFENRDRRITATEFFAQAPGQRIEVEGRWDGSVLVADAAEIYPWAGNTTGNPNGGNSDDNAHGNPDDDYAEIKGLVRARSGNLVTLDVIYAEYLNGVGNGSQLQVNLASASFKRGALNCLEAGAPVELKGYVDDSGAFRPVRVTLEGPCGGPRPAGGSSTGGTVFVEAEGTITAIGNNQFTLSVFYIEDLNGPAPATLTVTYDASTIFRQVPAQGLRTGMFVEVYGTLTGSTLRATRVEPD
jgi:hypothetical protein